MLPSSPVPCPPTPGALSRAKLQLRRVYVSSIQGPRGPHSPTPHMSSVYRNPRGGRCELRGADSLMPAQFEQNGPLIIGEMKRCLGVFMGSLGSALTAWDPRAHMFRSRSRPGPFAKAPGCHRWVLLPPCLTQRWALCAAKADRGLSRDPPAQPLVAPSCHSPSCTSQQA